MVEYILTNGNDRFVQNDEPEVTVRALGGDDEIILNLTDDDFGGYNTVDAGSGNDLVDNRFEGGNDIDLGSGNDYYIGLGFATNDRLYDIVSAGDGDDTFKIATLHSQYYGENGNDTFNSEGWENKFDGGSGIDTISYALRDTVNGTGVTIDLDREFSQTGTDRRETLISIENAVGTNANDTIFGSVVGNTLLGRGGNDYIAGLSGNDLINGGAGADRMYGGAGNDTYYVDNAGDVINEVTDNASGIDTVNSSISFSLIAGPRLAGNVENLNLTGTASINGTGNNLDNVIVGNSGANSLSGNGGNDTLNGGLGADTMAGGVGNDRYIVDNVADKAIEGNVAGVDKVQSSVSYSISGQFIENLTLTGTASINATGNSLANNIVGNAGGNIINGGTGNDVLTGGAGADRFVFNTPSGNANHDTITDFNVPADAIWMDNAVYSALGAPGLLAASAFHIGAAAADASDRIIYNSATGALFYDYNGSAAGGAVQFATLTKGLAMTNADFLII